MKLSETTLSYLKNFSSINSGMVFQEGNVIRTISKQQNVLAKAEVAETFEDKFVIYDLNRFLSLIGSLKDPNVEINASQKTMEITSDSSKTLYRLSDESLVVTPPAKDLNVSAEVEFLFTKDMMNQAVKMAGILGLPNLCVRGDRKNISIQVTDVKNPESDTFSIVVGNTKSEFDMIFSVENFKIISGDYDVKINSKGISHFKHTKESVEYWIAIEAGSKFST